MLLRLQNYLDKIKPVTLDGCLYMLIAICGSMVTMLNSDDAYKYFNPYVLYYSKFVVSVALAAVSALKMFRSTSYSEHLENKKQNEKIGA